MTNLHYTSTSAQPSTCAGCHCSTHDGVVASAAGRGGRPASLRVCGPCPHRQRAVLRPPGGSAAGIAVLWVRSHMLSCPHIMRHSHHAFCWPTCMLALATRGSPTDFFTAEVCRQSSSDSLMTCCAASAAATTPRCRTTRCRRVAERCCPMARGQVLNIHLINTQSSHGLP